MVVSVEPARFKVAQGPYQDINGNLPEWLTPGTFVLYWTSQHRIGGRNRYVARGVYNIPRGHLGPLIDAINARPHADYNNLLDGIPDTWYADEGEVLVKARPVGS